MNTQYILTAKELVDLQAKTKDVFDEHIQPISEHNKRVRGMRANIIEKIENLKHVSVKVIRKSQQAYSRKSARYDAVVHISRYELAPTMDIIMNGYVDTFNMEKEVLLKPEFKKALIKLWDVEMEQTIVLDKHVYELCMRFVKTPENAFIESKTNMYLKPLDWPHFDRNIELEYIPVKKWYSPMTWFAQKTKECLMWWDNVPEHEGEVLSESVSYIDVKVNKIYGVYYG